MAPGHWLPVVLLAKSRGWRLQTAALASLVTASGHVVLSLVLAGIAMAIGAKALHEYEHRIEAFAGLGLAVFGLFFAISSYLRHARCHGHTHHGPEPKAGQQPLRDALGFLFLVGFSPCVAIFPVFLAAMPWGVAGWVLTGVAFAAGVVAAIGGSVVVVSLGALKLDHPVFEHFGDVLTGAAMVLLGLGLFLFSGAGGAV
jgi:nickel/cobalt exporter